MALRITPEKIVHLNDGEIFVFGSNFAGRHGAGAALTALRKFGAINGQGTGLQGRSYGIPTKDRNLNVLSVNQITPHVNRFIKFAIENPQLIFLVTPIGTGLARYKSKDIAPLFAGAINLENVYLPKMFIDVLTKQN